MTSKEVIFLFPPFDGRSGVTYDKWELDMLDHGAGIVDDFGWSVADFLSGNDQGHVL